MSDTPPGSNVPEYSVSEISGALRRTVEETFALVRVKGEISGFKRHSSGHLYFCLKDADAVLDAVCWRGQAGRLPILPEDGIEVIATGRLTTYPGRSKYQMVIERMELAGQGALLKILEDRRRKLAAEGLFDGARKKALPLIPEVIGVVTSPTGAVIKDILHRLAERFPRHVLLWPVAVQGDGAATQVAAAIRGFNALPAGGRVPRPDVLIVARGGGSIEDLWAFNEECVVRAAAESAIPLISAVGHETDTTLIDYAADLRAPTPTAAAEKAVPVRAELLAQIGDMGARLGRAALRGLTERATRIDALARVLPNPRAVIEDCTRRLDDRAERLRLALPNLLHRRAAEADRLAARLKHPRELLAEKRHALERAGAGLDHALKSAAQAETARLGQSALRLDQTGHRLGPAMTRLLTERSQRLASIGQMLESVSYHRVLERGYAVVRDESGGVISSARSAQAGAALSVEFRDGGMPVRVEGAVKKAAKSAGDGRQGNLL